MATPADLLPIAEDLLADPVRLNPWIADQHDAAAAELDPLMKAIAEDMGKPVIEGEGEPRIVAFGMAVTQAILRRLRPERCCEHSGLVAPPPLMVFLGPGVITCEPCMPRFMYQGEEDERCDICDTQTKIFRDFWLRMGPSLIQGDGCPDCVGWLETLPGVGE